MATQTAKKVIPRRLPGDIPTIIEDKEINKLIIQDVILASPEMGIKIEVLKSLHSMWLTKLQDSDPDFNISIGTEWNNLKKIIKVQKKQIPKIKKVKRLISKPGTKKRSSGKENLDVDGKKSKTNLKCKSILISNNITKEKIGLSMPLLGDEIDVFHTVNQPEQGTLIMNNVSNNFSLTEETSKSNESDLQNHLKQMTSQTTDGQNKFDSYSEIVETDLDRENSVVGYKYRIEDADQDNYTGCIGDFRKCNESSIKSADVSASHILLNEHLPMFSVKRKHSIKECKRTHRKAVFDEKDCEINPRYQVIFAGKFLCSGFDYCKLDQEFFDVVIFLPNLDSKQVEKRKCMITVSSLLLEDNILDLIITPLLKTVKKFTDPEAAFVLQKSVDSAMEQIITSQLDGLPNLKIRFVQSNKSGVRPLRNEDLYSDIDSDDDISDEDQRNIEYNINAECKTTIYCCYKKITKRRNIFQINLYNGVIKINGKDRYFKTLVGRVIFH